MRKIVGVVLLVLCTILLLLFGPRGARSPQLPASPADPPAAPTSPAPSGPAEERDPEEGRSTTTEPVAIPPFRFRVTDSATGEPLEAVRIAPEGDPGEEPPGLRGEPARTDERGLGQFVVDHTGIGAVWFRAGKPAYLLMRGLARREETTRIRLTPGASVSGRVVHAVSGEPVEGAVVRAFVRADEWSETCLPAVSDREGVFLLDAVPPDRKVLLVARATGLVPARAEGSFPKEGGSIEIRVGGGGVLMGTVSRPDGSPAAGTDVWLVPSGYPLPPRRSDGHWLAGSQLERLILFLYPRIPADAAGGFRFEGVPLGREWIAVARLTEYREVESANAKFQRGGEVLVRDIHIPEPAKVTITARDDRREIVPHPQVDFRSARVWFDARNAGLRLDDGRIHIPEAPPGTWKLRAWIRGAKAIEREVTLSPGESAEIEFRVPSSPALEGIVVNPEGKPVPGSWVTVKSPPWISGTTDHAGRFRLTGLAGDAVDLEVMPGPSFDEEDERPLCPVLVKGVRPGGSPLRIVLPFGGFLTGRIPGFEPGTRFGLGVFSRAATSGGGLVLDAKGAFRTGAPRPDHPFLVKITCAGKPTFYAECAARKPGEDIDLGEIRFFPARVLEGRVVGPDGTPIEGAEVKLVERWLDASTRTDGEGRFRFRDMPARPIWALVKVKGMPWHYIVFEPPGGGPEPVVRLTRGGLLRATVVDPDGTPVATGEYLGWWLVSHPLDGDLDELRLYFAFRDGAFSHRLQPGRYRFRVWDEKHEGEAFAEFEIGEGAETTHRFLLRSD